MAAEVTDIQIVCSQYNVDVIPESFTEENEKILTVTKITNHPDYDPGTDEDDGANLKGPYAGNDISVYHVDDTKFRLKEGEVWPACLPRDEGPSSTGASQDFFAGWLDAEPVYRVQETASLKDYRESYLLPRKSQVQLVECSDPAWMNSSSFYPAGTLCYKDPSESSCFQFGNSGSSVMTHFTDSGGTERFAFTGPLSMHKGCDQVS